MDMKMDMKTNEMKRKFANSGLIGLWIYFRLPVFLGIDSLPGTVTLEWSASIFQLIFSVEMPTIIPRLYRD